MKSFYIILVLLTSLAVNLGRFLEWRGTKINETTPYFEPTELMSDER